MQVASKSCECEVRDKKVVPTPMVDNVSEQCLLMIVIFSDCCLEEQLS
jgi:hypothetical protein